MLTTELQANYRADFPETVPSLNRLLRLHWATRNQLLNKWRWIIRANRTPGLLPNLARVRVHITRTSPRSLDTDNLYGSCKVIVDALVREKIVVDDSPEYIELVCSQARGKPHTAIEITPRRTP